MGDEEAGKTSLQENALAGRPKPCPEERTIHLDFEKFPLTADLDMIMAATKRISQHGCRTLLALHTVVVDAQYATDEYACAVEDKLLRFLVVLQNRVPGAVVLQVVTKADTVKDPERLCHWLEGKIEKWRKDTRKAVCGNLPNSSSGIARHCGPPLATLMTIVMVMCTILSLSTYSR